jgi:3-oxoadipyl-CoA thiolase
LRRNPDAVRSIRRGFSTIRPDDLAAFTLRELSNRQSQVDWGATDDVIFGCANQAGEDNRNVARMALLLAGFPEIVPGTTVNRLCGSSLDAVMTGARAIRAGEADLVIAGGVESMSRAPFALAKADTAWSRKAEIYDTTIGWRFVNPLMEKHYGIDAMPETGENVAEQFGISRLDQDAFAFRSQQRYTAAAGRGFFERETVPVSVPQPKGAIQLVTADEQPRPNTTLEGLAKLRTVVRPDGTITAGNASGVNDGAAAIVLASESAVGRHGLAPQARFIAGAAVGVSHRGPARPP